MLVLGDFNLHAETGLTGAAQDFMASMTAMGLSQHVTGPTHERGHTLDLVFSMGQEEGGLRVRNLCLTPLSWSDHFLVRFVLESGLSLCKGVDPIVWVCPRSQTDPDGFLKALGEFPADKTGAPVKALVELWNGEMTRAIDTIAPKRPLLPGRAHSSPWYTPELRAMKQAGRRLERRWRRSRDESDQTHLRAHFRAYAVAVRAAKKKFFSVSIASSKCRLAELFRVVQGLVRPGPKKDLVSPSKACCDDFAKHFREKIAQIRHELDSTSDSEASGEIPMSPSGPKLMDEFQLLRPDDVDKVLGRLRPTTCLLDSCPSWLINNAKHGIGIWILEVVNTSLREGRVPAPLKEAVVRLVLKKASLDPDMATNYRPVANIPFLGKLLERVVVGQLQALLDETDYLDPFQFGFRPGYGTESALVSLYDDLCREKDRGSASLLVLLDLSAVFDTINHGIFLDRLAGLGVGGTALQWFCSYLNDQFQKVVLGDCGSAPWQLCHGVPQESILSPLLFNIYMKPLGEVIRRCGLQNHQYTDDTQLYLLFSTNPGEAVAVLNRCLAEVMGWMRANKLKLNPDKTEVLLVGGSGFGEGELNLVLNGVALPLRDKVHSLGVLLDPELSLEAQVTAVARSAFFQLQLIHQLRPYLEYDYLTTVTHALVTSRLDFCNALYVGLPLKMVRILQLVQNRAARLLTGTGRYVHMTPVLRQLHWLPIEVRAQFKVLVMTYKALNGLGPGYLKECLRPYMAVRPLRSAGEALLRKPSVKEIRRVITYILSFLSISDRKEASLVNQTWYLAAQDSLRQENVFYNIPASSASLRTIKNLARRHVCNVKMLNLDGSTTSRDVVKFVATYLGPHLHSLCLRGSSLTESSFEELLLSCPCLTALDLSGCNSLFMSGTLFSKEICLQAREALVHLQELNLSGIRYLSDLTFNHLTSCSSHLAKLSLARCHIVFESDAYYNSSNGYSSVLLSFHNLLQFLREQARTVKALDLSGTSISRQSMKSLVQVEHLNLQELVLQACQDLTNEAVSIMCQHQPHLTTLDLTGCSELSDQAVLVISSQLLDLRCLRLGKLPRLTDAGFRGISHLRYLQSLDVSECSLVSSSTLIQAFRGTEGWPKLVSLNFAFCSLLRYLKGYHKEEGQDLFLVMPECTTRNNQFKLRQSRFKVDIRKSFLTVRAIRQWDQLPKEAVGSPTLV
ncbi:putative RNA-directed DNA polymerase from transposon BS [Varanus komodoensis]|nr:putative RNA-directed DNA polymerase from transposon BS [Varanus komodoensis]